MKWSRGVESPGGLAHSYGLAASQLLRVREKNLNLVVAVDKVAASGGYLMAAVANRLIAAPFAVVGSIGVVAQVPNVHRLLKKKDVDVELITAGKYKRTLTVFGENTKEGREKFTDELEDLHALFQEFVVDKRPGLDLEKVATGEAWFGQRALDLNLVDEIMTSDEYLMQRCADTDVYEIRWKEPKKPLEKMLRPGREQHRPHDRAPVRPVAGPRAALAERSQSLRSSARTAMGLG